MEHEIAQASWCAVTYSRFASCIKSLLFRRNYMFTQTHARELTRLNSTWSVTIRACVLQVGDAVMPFRHKPDKVIGAVMVIGPSPNSYIPGQEEERTPLLLARIVSVSA